MSISKISTRATCILFLLVGCTSPQEPTAKHRIEYNIDLSDREIQPQQLKNLKIKDISGSLATADYFEYLETLGAKEAFITFYQYPQTSSRVKIEESPYADFIIAKSKDDFLKATNDLDGYFNAQFEIIQGTVEKTSKQFKFPNQDITISDSLQLIANYLSSFENVLNKSTADTAVKDAIVGELYKKFWLKLPAAANIVNKMEATDNLGAAVTVLRSLIEELNVDLTPEQQANLKSATELGQLLNRELDAQGAFTILVHVWELMTPKERIETFGEISPELNSYLTKQKNSSRDCLKRTDCNNFVLNFSKSFFILPSLKKYGVEKLRDTVDRSALEKIKSQTSSIATELVSDLPKILIEEIKNGMESEKQRFDGYRTGYDSFVRTGLKDWFDKSYSVGTLPALEATNINIKIGDSNIKITRPTPNDGSLLTSADAMGSALSASPRLLGNDQASIIVGLTRINQLLAHGGFSLYNGDAFPSLMRELFGKTESRSQNIENLFDWKSLFAMPTPVKISSGFQFSNNVVAKDFSIHSQARLLKGFSRMMMAFRDWEPSPFGDMMSGIKVKHILKDLPVDAVDRSAFPKEAFLAISLGNAAAILSNLKAVGTPLFIMCGDKSVVWADKSLDCKPTSALAGVVDIVESKRLTKVDTLSHAAFLESLIEFLTASEQIKKTKSEYLVLKTGSKNSPIEELNVSLPQLRNLALGMSNFLSHLLESSEGQFYKSYDLKNKMQSSDPASFSLQIAGIRAMLKAANYFQLKPYRMSAINAYLYMNRELWDDKTGFYTGGNTPPITKLEVSSAAHVLELLLTDSLLAAQSNAQLQKMIEHWKQSLK